MTDRYDNRGEWFREWDAYSTYINSPPRWYWIGMLASALWLVIYLLIYPSIPFLHTHWQGLGVPTGCQPWTSICEMRQGEGVLKERRARFIEKIQEKSVVELTEDSEIKEFISRAGKVPFADNCAGCHGRDGAGIKDGSAPVLNDEIWLHGGKVQSIRASIESRTVHPFGLVSRIDGVSAKILAIYVYKLGGGVPTNQN